MLKCLSCVRMSVWSGLHFASDATKLFNFMQILRNFRDLQQMGESSGAQDINVLSVTAVFVYISFLGQPQLGSLLITS